MWHRSYYKCFSKVHYQDDSSNYTKRLPRINFLRDRGRYCITSKLCKAEMPQAKNLNLRIKKILQRMDNENHQWYNRPLCESSKSRGHAYIIHHLYHLRNNRKNRNWNTRILFTYMTRKFRAMHFIYLYIFIIDTNIMIAIELISFFLLYYLLFIFLSNIQKNF